MLIYSNGYDLLDDKIVETFREKTKEYTKNIFLIWHPGPNKEPEIINQ